MLQLACQYLQYVVGVLRARWDVRIPTYWVAMEPMIFFPT
jgi:hypothetical protein